jgi:hypothetical protein
MRTRSLFLAAITLLVVSAALHASGLIHPIIPRSWASAHVGMSREQLHALLGAPTTDSLALKGLDRWQERALLGESCLDIFYWSSESPAAATRITLNSYSRLSEHTTLMRGEALFSE